MGTRNHVLDGGKVASPGHAWTCSVVDILQSNSAEGSTGTARTPIRGTTVDGVLNHCLNLANTTEPSVCGGDTALCQITLTIVEYGIMPAIARGRYSDGPIPQRSPYRALAIGPSPSP